jgi:hypothetical protein
VVRLEMTERELRDSALALNCQRRSLSRAERRDLIAARLREGPESSNRKIAGLLGADHHTVAAVRIQLEAVGEIPQLDRTLGKDDRLRAARRPQTPEPAQAQAAASRPAAVGNTGADADTTERQSASKSAAHRVVEGHDSQHLGLPSSPHLWVPRSTDLPLERAARLAPGQLEADWDGDDWVTFSRHGVPLVQVPVLPTRQSDRSFTKPGGNRKCAGVAGVANACGGGCGRILTGFHGCQRPCFSDVNGLGGCYGNCTEFARQHANQQRLYNVVSNGAVNACLKIRVPQDGDFTLPTPHLLDPLTQPALYRVDGESTTGDLSIALGLFQRFAWANPDLRLFTFCANYFRPGDAQLEELAALNNIWTIHTLSGWFLHRERGRVISDELESRLAAIERFVAAGVPTVIAICTRTDWDNDTALRRALDLVSRDRVIETPFRIGNHAQERPLLDANPNGACGDYRVDADGRPVQVIEEDGVSRVVAARPDGRFEEPKGTVHARCAGCRLVCGHNAIFGRDAGAVGEGRLAA